MDLKSLAPFISVLGGLVQAMLPIAKALGVEVKELLAFLAAKGTASGDTKQLQQDLTDWIAARAEHQTEANRTE